MKEQEKYYKDLNEFLMQDEWYNELETQRCSLMTNLEIVLKEQDKVKAKLTKEFERMKHE